MDHDYSWDGGIRRGTSSFRLPQSEGMGKWFAIAFFVAVLLHVLVLIGLSRIDVSLPDFVSEKAIQTDVVRVHRVDMTDARPEITPPESGDILEPEPVVPPADELDMLEDLPEIDIDISPNIKELEIPMAKAASAGSLDGVTVTPMKAPVFESNIPDMGETEDFFPRSRDSQVTVDPGSRKAGEHDPDAYADDLRKGADGSADQGLLKEFTSLDAMANMDGNSLLTSKALIGSDLLFDFNSYTLRQSARVSLMKVALLIDKHPDLVCWVDGHTDLIGGDEANRLLSLRRAQAVKDWLVKTLDIGGDRIAVRGFGETFPLVKQGAQEEQAPNRRVEIKMRKGQPEEPLKPKGDVEVVGETENSPARAVPVEDDEPVVPEPPRAIVEPEEPRPIVPLPPRAIPVE